MNKAIAMNADCAFRIGRTHLICQDYAVAAAQGGAAFAVLADGCSSSADTDIGARLLAKSAERLLPSVPVSAEDSRWEACHTAAARAAAVCARRLDLPFSCLDATLMTIKAENGAFAVCCSGDGVVALGRHDGTIEVSVLSFAASYPQYVSYKLDKERRRQWDAQEGNAKTIQRWTLTGQAATAADPQESRAAAEVFAGTAAEYRFAAVLSDGVQSFARTEQTQTSRTTFPVPAAEVLAEMLAFKSGQGQCVQRRIQAFGKQCVPRGWQHADDISLAVVWLGD